MTVVGIVEDNPDVVKMLQAAIETMPDVDSVVVPINRAVEASSWQNVDVAIVDLDMEIPGEEILAYLGNEHPHIKRVIASAMHERVLRAALQADEVLLKPYNLRLLRNIISDLDPFPVIEPDAVIVARKAADTNTKKMKRGAAALVIAAGVVGFAFLVVDTGRQLISPSQSSPSTTLVPKPHVPSPSTPPTLPTVIIPPTASRPDSRAQVTVNAAPVVIGIPSSSPVNLPVLPVPPVPIVTTPLPTSQLPSLSSVPCILSVGKILNLPPLVCP